MEYLYLIAGLAVFFVFVILNEIKKDRDRKAAFEYSLRKDYGKLRKREYSPERYLRICSYFEKHRENDSIDDITWNDLGMDEVFKAMNHTYSACGEEYLYYLLHTVSADEEELEKREAIIRHFMENEDRRVYLQTVSNDLGYLGKYSLYDYLDNLDYLGERSNAKHYISILLLLLCLPVMVVSMPIGIFGFSIVMIFNIVSYFKEKKDIEPYIVSFMFIIRLIRAGEKLAMMPGMKDAEVLKPYHDSLEQKQKVLRALKKRAYLLAPGSNTGGNPFEVLLDYAKMVFHVDLIRFNQMLKFVKVHLTEIDELNSLFGELEAMVAVGAFRKGLEMANGYCVPVHSKDYKTLTLENGYHPLLAKPVKNSISASKCVLLTGSNASGKSTFLKTVAINAILSQSIHTCSCDRYEGPFYRIYSSMALRDDLAGGESYYIVEIKALKRILTAANEPGRPILCFVDEVLRGTNTVERIAASCEILRSLREKSITCFAATHDIELTDLLSKEYDNYHFEEEVQDGDITFQYRLLNGKATTRNAIKLLGLIGYENSIIEKAEERAGKFLATGSWS